MGASNVIGVHVKNNIDVHVYRFRLLIQKYNNTLNVIDAYVNFHLYILVDQTASEAHRIATSRQPIACE